MLHAFRVKGFKYKHTQSNNCDLMCCLNHPNGKGPWEGRDGVEKVQRDAASPRRWYVEAATPHRDDSTHWHVQREMVKALKKIISNRSAREEVHTTLRDMHLSWGTPVFKAGWYALSDHYAATPHCLAHAQKEYIASRKRGANGKPVQEYGMQVAQWQKTLATISNGGRGTWPQFLDFLRVHCVTVEACTCGTYCTLAVCEGCLLRLLVKEAGFKVPLRYFWRFDGSRPFKFGRVKRSVVTRVEAPHVRAMKSQGGPPKKKAAKGSQELLCELQIGGNPLLNGQLIWSVCHRAYWTI